MASFIEDQWTSCLACRPRVFTLLLPTPTFCLLLLSAPVEGFGTHVSVFVNKSTMFYPIESGTSGSTGR